MDLQRKFRMQMNDVLMAQARIAMVNSMLMAFKQLMALPDEKRAEVLADLEKAVMCGDLSKLPPDIKII